MVGHVGTMFNSCSKSKYIQAQANWMQINIDWSQEDTRNTRSSDFLPNTKKHSVYLSWHVLTVREKDKWGKLRESMMNPRESLWNPSIWSYWALTNSHAVACVPFDHLAPLEIFGIYFIQTHPVLPPNFFNTHHVHGSNMDQWAPFWMIWCFIVFCLGGKIIVVDVCWCNWKILGTMRTRWTSPKNMFIFQHFQNFQNQICMHFLVIMAKTNPKNMLSICPDCLGKKQVRESLPVIILWSPFVNAWPAGCGGLDDPGCVASCLWTWQWPHSCWWPILPSGSYSASELSVDSGHLWRKCGHVWSLWVSCRSLAGQQYPCRPNVSSLRLRPVSSSGTSSATFWILESFWMWCGVWHLHSLTLSNHQIDPHKDWSVFC